MNVLTRSVLVTCVLAAAGCGSKRPENAIVADFPCLEIEHYGAVLSGKQAFIDDVIVRVKSDDESCPGLASVEAVLFDDDDGDGRDSESEEIFKVYRDFAEHTVSARLEHSTITMVQGIAVDALKLRITVTDHAGGSFDTLHDCTE